jgi:hypothetical protein
MKSRVAKRLLQIAEIIDRDPNLERVLVALEEVLSYYDQKYIFMEDYSKEEAELLADDWSAGPVHEVPGGVMMEVGPDFIDSYLHSEENGIVYVEPLEGFEIYPVTDKLPKEEVTEEKFFEVA